MISIPNRMPALHLRRRARFIAAWLYLSLLRPIGAVGGDLFSIQMDPPGSATPLLILPDRIQLEPITAFDLFQTPNDYAIAIDHSGELQAPPFIRRAIPTLWQIPTPHHQNPANVRVRIDLTAANGRPNRLSNTADLQADIQVIVRPTAPRQRETADAVWLEGGADLQLNTQNIRMAGVYRGTLTVIVDNL